MILGGNFSGLATATESAALAALRSDVDEVKGRLDKVSRAAARPMLDGGTAMAGPEVKGFVDGYLRHGRETELKSLSAATGADGGYAVPQEIDTMIASRLVEISPIRAVANVVRTGTAGFRRLISTGSPFERSFGYSRAVIDGDRMRMLGRAARSPLVGRLATHSVTVGIAYRSR